MGNDDVRPKKPNGFDGLRHLGLERFEVDVFVNNVHRPLVHFDDLVAALRKCRGNIHELGVVRQALPERLEVACSQGFMKIPQNLADNLFLFGALGIYGARFIAPVERAGNGGGEGPRPEVTTDNSKSERFLNLRLARAHARERFAWSVALLLLVISGLAGVAWVRGRPSPSQPARPIRSSLLPPPNTSYLPSNFELSPDGTRLAFVAADANGSTMLWVRALSAAGAQQFSSTEGARFPFWSPDGRAIGFFSAGKLRTLDIASGAVHVLCEAPAGMGGKWSRDGTIVFTPNIAGPLNRVAAAGGISVPATPIPRDGSGQNHIAPWFLPDGKHFLYVAVHSVPSDRVADGIYVGSLGDADVRLVSSESVGKVAFSSGRVLYVKGGNLLAQIFDPERLRTTGAPTVMTEQELEPDPGFFGSAFSVAQTGLLAFQSTLESASHLIWADQSGKELAQIPVGGFRDPSLSPDGRLLAVSSDDAHDGKRYIRAYDLARGVSIRLTSGGTDREPVWSSNGREITFASKDGNLSLIYNVAADGSSPPQMLLKGANMGPRGWSRSGDLLLGRLLDGNPDLAIYSLADHQARQFARGVEAQFSPNGKWIAYVWRGVYVQAFPGAGPRIQVSDHGGGQPRWSHDGRQLFYIAPDRKLMAVNFDPRSATAGAPRLLFQTRIVAPSYAGFQYDVARDGRFLINSMPPGSSLPLTLVSSLMMTR